MCIEGILWENLLLFNFLAFDGMLYATKINKQAFVDMLYTTKINKEGVSLLFANELIIIVGTYIS